MGKNRSRCLGKPSKHRWILLFARQDFLGQEIYFWHRKGRVKLIHLSNLYSRYSLLSSIQESMYQKFLFELIHFIVYLTFSLFSFGQTKFKFGFHGFSAWLVRQITTAIWKFSTERHNSAIDIKPSPLWTKVSTFESSYFLPQLEVANRFLLFRSTGHR